MQVDLNAVEEASKDLYIRALKILPDDIKHGFTRLDAAEHDPRAKSVLATMIRNVSVDGFDLEAAIVRGCARATREYPLRSSVVHPITRKNEHTSCGIRVPVIHVGFSDQPDTLSIEMIPKGSGSENNTWLRMAIPAEGVNAIRTFVVDCVLDAGGKTCPPTIVGVGVGGSADLCGRIVPTPRAGSWRMRCRSL